MSAASSGKSHTTAWTLGVVVGVLVLYVATWPIVKIKGAKSFFVAKAGIPGSYVHVHPPWMESLYRPVDFLSGINPDSNPLRRYYNWWMGHLPSPPKVAL